jgi:hypothetical protein
MPEAVGFTYLSDVAPGQGLATPNWMEFTFLSLASLQIKSVNPSTFLVSRGSMMPSSSMRARGFDDLRQARATGHYQSDHAPVVNT